VTERQLVAYRDGELLAAATAARLVTALADAQAARGSASVVLTGGRVGIAVLAQARVAPARDSVDWSTVDFYWGDERFLPAGHADRNETQARAALLDHVPVDPSRVHPMPSERAGLTADDAARTYADVLAAAAGPGADHPVPDFDVLLLGVGEEGHTASVFPYSSAVHETERTVVAVLDCPKPPPVRITMTLPAIREAAEVWLATAGEGKADAVASALGGAGEIELPAAGARGRNRTRWLLDNAAAAKAPGMSSSPR
jgi:6-phosphogluconolactonase